MARAPNASRTERQQGVVAPLEVPKWGVVLHLWEPNVSVYCGSSVVQSECVGFSGSECIGVCFAAVTGATLRGTGPRIAPANVNRR